MSRYKHVRLVLSAGLVCSFVSLFTPAANADEVGEIVVKVVAAQTKRPLSGITVTITPRNGSPTVVSTSVDGTAMLENLGPGLYEVRAAAAGLVTGLEPSVRVIARKATPVQMELLALDNFIDEVVVVARAVQADTDGAVSNSYRNREELRSAVGAGSDVMRALDGLPGLISTGDFANFSVRGRGPRDNLIFVDGIPLDKVVHFDQTLGEEEDIGGGGRFSIFAPNSITGAEFSPGGWGAAYGGRSGSLLQLDVAGGSPTPSASLRVDIAGVELGYEGPIGFHDNTTVFLTARQFDFGRVFETIGEKDIGQPKLSDFILKTVTEIDERDTFEVLAVLAPEKYSRDIDNVLESPNFEDVALLNSEQDLGLLGVSWKRLMGDSGEWVNRVYVRSSDKTSSEGEAFPDLVPLGAPVASIPVNERLITVNEDETELGWRSDYTTQNRWGKGSAGLRITQTDVEFATDLRTDWIRYVYRTTDTRPLGQNYIVLTPANVNTNYQAREISYAAYAEQVFELAQWDFRAGLRYDEDGFADQSLVSPRLAVNYRYSPDVRFSATVGLFFQSPRFLNRAANTDNILIQNERIAHFSVGFERGLSEHWNLLVEPYYQQLDDLVTEASRLDGRVTNNGEGTSYGVDFVLLRTFANGWSASANYSYNTVRLDDQNGGGEYDADFSRPHFFSMGGTWEISERWKVGARWKYASGRPTDDFIVNADVLGPGQPLRFSKQLTSNNALRLENYHSLNVRVDYRRPFGPVDLIAFLDVINVYGGPGANSQEFDPRRGINVVADTGAFPIIGIIFERTW